MSVLIRPGGTSAAATASAAADAVSSGDSTDFTQDEYTRASPSMFE